MGGTHRRAATRVPPLWPAAAAAAAALAACRQGWAWPSGLGERRGAATVSDHSPAPAGALQATQQCPPCYLSQQATLGWAPRRCRQSPPRSSSRLPSRTSARPRCQSPHSRSSCRCDTGRASASTLQSLQLPRPKLRPNGCPGRHRKGSKPLGTRLTFQTPKFGEGCQGASAKRRVTHQ